MYVDPCTSLLLMTILNILILNEFKNEAFEKFKKFKLEVGKQVGKDIHTLRSDRCIEYLK